MPAGSKVVARVPANQVENHPDIRREEEHAPDVSMACDLENLERQEGRGRDDHQPAGPVKSTPKRPRFEEREQTIETEDTGSDLEMPGRREVPEQPRESHAPCAHEVLMQHS